MSYSQKYRVLLEGIVEEADAIAMRYFRTTEMGTEKKGDGSVVTVADKAVEAMALRKVAESGLEIEVVGEETSKEIPQGPARDGRARMIIDPIDGTEEFSRGIPTFGTLIGIEEKGEIVAGMVSAPALSQGTRWWAYRGEGAYRAGKRIHVSQRKKLDDAMFFTTGTGWAKNMDARMRMRRMADAARASRSIGGFWQHMLVAEGAVEAAVDWLSKPWDLAPLGIIVEEAGGRSTTIEGERTIYKGRFVSTNGILHEQVLRLLQGDAS
ncbi:MAG TPA: inositol monophosphatase family protein [Verrucomicrobiae bacterium]|nr:inositol monophosphatase family protein [Verrucomicrobiae bacterium]